MNNRFLDNKLTDGFNGTRFVTLLLFCLANLLANSLLNGRPITLLGSAISFLKIAGVIVFYELLYMIVCMLLTFKRSK
jgi:hypothetical protein